MGRQDVILETLTKILQKDFKSSTVERESAQSGCSDCSTDKGILCRAEEIQPQSYTLHTKRFGKTFGIARLTSEFE